MKVWILVFWVAASLFSCATTTPTSKSTADQASSKDPNKVAAGEELSLVDSRLPFPVTGRVTLVNFWATWCASCKVELKEMETEFQKLDRAGNAVGFAFVSVDKESAKAQTWLDENMNTSKIVSPNLISDPSFAIAKTFQVDSFPMTFLIDQSGKVIHVQRGFEENKNLTENLTDRIEALIQKS